MKKPFLFLFILNTAFLSFSQAVRGSYYDFLNQTESMPVKPNPSTLIIYRPENKEPLNEIRCFLKIEDDKGNDVTYDSSICTATYEWINWRSDLTYITKIDATYFTSIFQRPYQGTVKNYQHTYYLSGGMATHLNLKKGKYKITIDWASPNLRAKRSHDSDFFLMRFCASLTRSVFYLQEIPEEFPGK